MKNRFRTMATFWSWLSVASTLIGLLMAFCVLAAWAAESHAAVNMFLMAVSSISLFAHGVFSGLQAKYFKQLLELYKDTDE